MDPLALKNRLMDLTGSDVDRLIGHLSYEVQHNPAVATAVGSFFTELDQQRERQATVRACPNRRGYVRGRVG